MKASPVESQLMSALAAPDERIKIRGTPDALVRGISAKV
jgi:hypothetical protein